MELEGWDKIYKKHGITQVECLKKVEDFVSTIKQCNAKEVLDLGCGTGRHSIYLAEQGFTVKSTDISDTGIEILNKRANDLGLKNISTYIHDMREIPFEDETFDAVLCTLDRKSVV